MIIHPRTFPIPMRRRVAGAALAALALALLRPLGAAELSVAAGASGLTLQRTLDAVALRGFGRVSGRQWTAAGGGSVLEIACESADRAQLTLAKYVSDLHEFPGVEAGAVAPKGAAWGATPLTVHAVKDQGEIVALRSAAKVFIVAAPDRAALERLLAGAFTGSAAGASSVPETAVPMWLDRFDRYGFRFYYGPFWLPPPEAMADGAKPETYDFRQDFAFAKESGAGLLMWAKLSAQGASEGVTSANWFGWVEDFAKPMGIPIGINLSGYNHEQANWVVDRYRSRLAQPMPCYLGDSMSIAGWRGTQGKVGELAWGADEARDAEFGALQQVVRRFAKEPNLVSWLEPHGEFYQGGDLFMGYGPAVDATFRDYLKGKYRTVAALNAAWEEKLRGFEAVKAPELAEFAGWTPEALDLAGPWRVGHPKDAAPDDWFAPGFDDSAWLPVTAPGDDHAFFLPKQPAVYRRTIDVPAARFPTGHRAWIYLWDLNVAWDRPVSIWLNGTKIGESPCRHPNPHWMVAEATAALRPGANQVALSLPNGYLGYRVYLSRTEPKQYPAFSRGLDAKWADYIDWREHQRLAAARRGVEMIREVDHERQIDFMAPGQSADGLKALAMDYGGNFKNTGFMAGVWADLEPQLMRGSRLPFTLEPGGPPGTVHDLRRMLGLYCSEAVQGVDYFIHIGCVEWNPEIRAAFLATQPLWHAFGKYHAPNAEVACLWDTRLDTLVGFPWGSDLDTNCGSGWSCRQVSEALLTSHPRDGVTACDFDRGEAARYKVIVDLNTSVMGEDMLARIERYVRDGGVFVTTGQSGRHAPDRPDSWPIAKLTGYEVLSFERYGPPVAGDPHPGSPWQPLAPAADQPVFPAAAAEWMKSGYNTGLRLKRVAPDAQDLLVWRDGTVAAGMRRLGKGWIVEFGCKDNGSGVRLAPEALHPILDWAGVARNRSTVEAVCTDDPQAGPECLPREYVSNNGLYDLWMLWNASDRHPISATVVLKEARPARALDLLADREVAVQDGRIAPVALPPLETRLLLTPRGRIAQAPLEWFELQRGWWRGTTPVTKGFPAPSERWRVPLDDGWAWSVADDASPAETWASPGFDDSAWPRTALGIVAAPDLPVIRHVALRRTFTVPAAWKDGTTTLSLRSCEYPDFASLGRIWLDGKLLQNWGAEAIDRIGAGGFPAGSTHTLLIETRTDGAITGVPGNCWLAFVPKPERSIDLAGAWTTMPDLFHAAGEATLPGGYRASALRRSVAVGKAYRGRTAVLSMDGERAFRVMVNGTYIDRSGGPTKNGNAINITPFLRYDADNVIELLSHYGSGNVTRVALDFYDPALGFP